MKKLIVSIVILMVSLVAGAQTAVRVAAPPIPPLTISKTVNTSDQVIGTLTVTNTSTIDFTTAIAAAGTAATSYGVRATGGNAGVLGESTTGAVQSTGGRFVCKSTGDSSTGVDGQVLNDSVNSTFGGSFFNAGVHATNYGLTAFANAAPAAWFLTAGSNTQPTLLVREGFGGSGATVPMIAVDNDADVHTFAVRAGGTIVHAGGVLDIVGTGAPAGACVTGSMYRRTDGGTNTTLYICETTAWVAK